MSFSVAILLAFYALFSLTAIGKCDSFKVNKSYAAASWKNSPHIVTKYHWYILFSFLSRFYFAPFKTYLLIITPWVPAIQSYASKINVPNTTLAHARHPDCTVTYALIAPFIGRWKSYYLLATLMYLATKKLLQFYWEPKYSCAVCSVGAELCGEFMCWRLCL